eukprot:5252312-Pyramimonas_sp.AAC.1
MDILSPLGFAHLIALAVALEEKGLNSNAPVCSSWVWVNRNTAGRRVDRPLGHPPSPRLPLKPSYPTPSIP